MPSGILVLFSHYILQVKFL